MFTWLCPSRGRPELAIKFLKSVTDRQTYDKVYKEVHEAQDQAEMDKVVEEQQVVH